MRATTKFLLPSIATALVLSACGSNSSTSGGASSASSPPARSNSVGTKALVRTAANRKLGGTILVDARGLTLYRLSGEQSGRFICANAGCLKVWHPLLAVSGSAPSGTVGSLSTVTRPAIGEQVTYKGMPLYTFAQDTVAGETKGQGIKDVGVWSAVTAGASAATAPTAPAVPPTSSGGGRSAY